MNDSGMNWFISEDYTKSKRFIESVNIEEAPEFTICAEDVHRLSRINSASYNANKMIFFYTVQNTSGRV